MASNAVWRITWGDYDFSLDRQTLTYDLTETQTGTVWASGLSVGWMELENRATGERIQHDFAGAKLVSVAEKSSAQGKRLLLGLDLLGVPIDLYFICSQREIQLTVEASRDTREYLVQDVGLLPGLVSVPDDDKSYLVLPIGEGAGIYASKVTNEQTKFAVWYYDEGLSMPFVGAVRYEEEPISAVSLITDSIYAEVALERKFSEAASLSPYFGRDSERRRLDIRLQVFPQGDHITIAQSYREKLIEDRNHVTLRRKIRENPKVESLIGCGFVELNTTDNVPAIFTATDFREAMSEGVGDTRILFSDIGNYGTDRISCLRENNTDKVPAEQFRRISGRGNLTALSDDLRYCTEDNSGRSSIEERNEWFNFATSIAQEGVDAIVLLQMAADNFASSSKWDELEDRLEYLQHADDKSLLIGSVFEACDWSFSAIDFTSLARPHKFHKNGFFPLPLLSVIYRDCLVVSYQFDTFSNLLIRLSLPYVGVMMSPNHPSDYLQKIATNFQKQLAVLGPLHELTFSAFLTKHLRDTFGSIEEATYSDKTYVIVNQSETDAFERGDLHLPPLGFYVRHAQMEAHYALRVGEQVFETPTWRIRRARDGKRLEESVDVLYQEFPV